ncbi:NAD(P)/FAD-dependent oxidoreductase [Rhizobium sp. RM]|uniref:NAD(P)/FAD-dependent oxidoreductase n=1 Tax=Rhizobium sp. RM TaxID=2748079 RepID=UPI00110E91EB|nr:NAD(P)/FAD-dependent oxidoreductase [Rhizobium sp. RM]NWJ27276.1 NAD(P)/FAD-dependent oxidoreductase [Rhizobium sp. RM]TMV20336.1 NAD(P)/FAD-dependent oxidoreductase [Rhizobium sp. Td3]
MDEVECIVVGAGAVGISIARSLSLSGKEVLVLEAEPSFGFGTSSRNSEVIHAGIYYPRDSLMARFCVSGRDLMYEFCSEHHVEHRRCGKLIVATSEDEATRLPGIAKHAHSNGVSDLVTLSEKQALQMEPNLNVVAALYSPSTGIVDSHAFMLAMVGQAEANGALFSYRSPFVSAELGERTIVSVGGAEPMNLACRWLINAAGLVAPNVAGLMRGFPTSSVPKAYFAKGNYFNLASGKAPFSRLIYPVPVAGGLGVHLTLDLMGQARFGPDVEWIEEIAYEVNPGRSRVFYEAIRRYWPELPDDSLQPAYSGIRPKIVPPEVAKQDFQILGPREHGIPGVVQLFGIESPGLTSSLAIGDYVNDLLLFS